MTKKIKEIIVVEGKHDTQAIRRAVNADTIETGGSALSDRTLSEIKRAQLERGVIIFTDPDGSGERIRRLVAEQVTGVKHAFIPRAKARGKGKIGVEHATDATIIEALAQVRTETEMNDDGMHEIAWDQYIDLGFVGQPHSTQFREHVAMKLGIGYANGKNFFRRLQVLHIGKEELVQAIEQVRKDQGDVRRR